MPGSWITDLRHFLDDAGLPVGGLPGRRAAYWCQLIEAATVRPDGVWGGSAVHCRRSPRRVRCTGYVRVRRSDATETVEWECPTCGDRGVISGWAEMAWDLRGAAAAQSRAWNLATHAIDPDMDEARQYVTQDLALSQVVEWVGFVDGVGMATPDAPHRNHMGAKWWSDGLRAVMQLAGDAVPLEDIRFFDWDWRYDPGDLQELLSERDDPEAASGAAAAASPFPGCTGGACDP